MSEITLRQAQDAVDEFIRTVGVRYFSELSNLAQLMEEVGEVARIMVRLYGDQSFRDPNEQHDLSDELADVLFVLLAISNQTEVDLSQALVKNLQKKTVRDSERHSNNLKLRAQPPTLGSGG